MLSEGVLVVLLGFRWRVDETRKRKKREDGGTEKGHNFDQAAIVTVQLMFARIQADLV
jgi:hypothetical protein